MRILAGPSKSLDCPGILRRSKSISCSLKGWSNTSRCDSASPTPCWWHNKSSSNGVSSATRPVSSLSHQLMSPSPLLQHSSTDAAPLKQASSPLKPSFHLTPSPPLPLQQPPASHTQSKYNSTLSDTAAQSGRQSPSLEHLIARRREHILKPQQENAAQEQQGSPATQRPSLPPSSSSTLRTPLPGQLSRCTTHEDSLLAQLEAIANKVG